MSRSEIEVGLKELSIQEAQLRHDASTTGLFTTDIPTSGSNFPRESEVLDVPRSKISHSALKQSPAPFISHSGVELGEESILPRRGDEVLPFNGPVHAVVEVLMKRHKTPTLTTTSNTPIAGYVQETSLPIVAAPPSPPTANFKGVESSFTLPESALLHNEQLSPAPQPSIPIPTIPNTGVFTTPKSPDKVNSKPLQQPPPPSSATSPIPNVLSTENTLAPPSVSTPPELLEGAKTHEPSQFFESRNLQRQVLFIYPPDLDIETIIECYRFASDKVLNPQDQLTILWADGVERVKFNQREEETSPESSKCTLGEDSQPIPQIFSGSPEDFDEASEIPAPPLILKGTEALRERAPMIHKLVTETNIKDKPFTVKLQPKAGLFWTIQQELQSNAAKRRESPYDLVTVPCLRPECGSNTLLEKFILEHSPVPVVLVRGGP